MQKYFFSKTTLHNTTPYYTTLHNTTPHYTISGASVRGWIVYKHEPDEIKRIKQERTSGHPDNIY